MEAEYFTYWNQDQERIEKEEYARKKKESDLKDAIFKMKVEEGFKRLHEYFHEKCLNADDREKLIISNLKIDLENIGIQYNLLHLLFKERI